MLMNPSLMLEMSTAACLVKEEALERSGWFKGSKEKREFCSNGKHDIKIKLCCYYSFAPNAHYAEVQHQSEPLHGETHGSCRRDARYQQFHILHGALFTSIHPLLAHFLAVQIQPSKILFAASIKVNYTGAK